MRVVSQNWIVSSVRYSSARDGRCQIDIPSECRVLVADLKTHFVATNDVLGSGLRIAGELRYLGRPSGRASRSTDRNEAI